MKVKISLDITDSRSECSARSCTVIGPPTDAIWQFLVVAYRGERRSVSLSSVFEELSSGGDYVPECGYDRGHERGDNSCHPLTHVSR